MMRALLISLITLSLLCAACAGAFAQTAQPSAPRPPEFSARVQVVIDAHQSIKAVITKCITQNLQALGDVTITDDRPQYRLTIMALPNITREENIGATLSVLITRPFDTNLLRSLLLSENIGDREKKLLLLLLRSKYERIEKNSLLTTSPEQLCQACKEIVAGFDTDILDKDRRLWSLLWKRPAKSKESPK